MVHLCIDHCLDCQIQGRAYNNTIKEEIIFNDIHELVLKVDSIFNTNGNPLSFEEKRSFSKKINSQVYQHKPILYNDYLDFMNYHGTIATFDIVVLTRMKSSWQGILFYQEQSIEFKDVLELIKIIIELLHL